MVRINLFLEVFTYFIISQYLQTYYNHNEYMIYFNSTSLLMYTSFSLQARVSSNRRGNPIYAALILSRIWYKFIVR